MKAAHIASVMQQHSALLAATWHDCLCAEVPILQDICRNQMKAAGLSSWFVIACSSSLLALFHPMHVILITKHLYTDPYLVRVAW